MSLLDFFSSKPEIVEPVREEPSDREYSLTQSQVEFILFEYIAQVGGVVPGENVRFHFAPFEEDGLRRVDVNVRVVE